MGLRSKCLIAGAPDTMVMFECGIDQRTGSPPVTQTCRVEEGGPCTTTALGLGWAVIQPCADDVAALG
jgi:hypothetical protein